MLNVAVTYAVSRTSYGKMWNSKELGEERVCSYDIIRGCSFHGFSLGLTLFPPCRFLQTTHIPGFFQTFGSSLHLWLHFHSFIHWPLQGILPGLPDLLKWEIMKDLMWLWRKSDIKDMTGNMSEATFSKNFLKLAEPIKPQIQEALWIWNRINIKKTASAKTTDN